MSDPFRGFDRQPFCVTRSAFSQSRAPPISVTGDPLFDDATAEIGIRHSPLRTCDGIAQGFILDPFPSGITHEPLRLEDPHSIPYLTL